MVLAFRLRLTGLGVAGRLRLVAGEEAVMRGTGEWEGGLVRAGGWMSTALGGC